MAWKYRIKEVRLTTGETRYYPQFKLSWFPFWAYFKHYEGTKLYYVYYSDALEWVNKSKSEDEPEIKEVVKHHYL